MEPPLGVFAMKKSAFTLIELLVVVTIIVVLLALLVPSLDRAIYQTELTVCGTRLKGISTAVQTYAADFKRHYPYRYGPANQSWKANNIYIGSTVGQEGQPNDERPLLRTIMSVNGQLNDPLSEEANYDTASPESQIEIVYNLWYGWQFRVGSPQRGMNKMGDRFAYTQSDGAGNTLTYRFDLLAGDMDVMDEGNAYGYASHADDEGRMRQLHHQDTSDVAGGAETGALQYVITRWQAATAERGKLDLNFAHDDGSVSRLLKVKDHVGTSPDTDVDDRVVGTPIFNDGAYTATGFAYIPPVR